MSNQMLSDDLYPAPNRFRVSDKGMEHLSTCMSDFAYGRGHLSGFYKNFLGGEWVRKFEEAFAKYIGTKYAISVSSGTAALHTLLTAIDEDLSTTVATTPYTFVATATAIDQTGYLPVFLDISPNLTLNPAAQMPKMRVPYDDEPSIVLPVHLLGNLADIEGIMKRWGDAYVIEDACQALGAEDTFRNKKAGALADAAVFSFQETKSMTTLGEGGMIVTDNSEWAEKCHQIRNHGEKYARGDILGYNYRMTEPAAAYGLGELEEYPDRLKLQQECADIVINNLPEGIRPLPQRAHTRSSDYIIGCFAEDDFPRKEWVEEAQAKLNMKTPLPGKTIGLGYTELITDLPYFQNNKEYWFAGPLNYARYMMQHSVWLDIHRFVSQDVVKARMDALKDLKT